jgi:hypothetical protein
MDGRLNYMHATVDRRDFKSVSFEQAKDVLDESLALVESFTAGKMFVSAYDNFAWLRAK